MTGVLATTSVLRRPPSRARAGRKTASRIFLRLEATRTGKTPAQVAELHQENFSTATKVASGVRYYGLRYYQPSTGRWLSRDPIGEKGGLNLYGYVANNPINAIDPLGLDTYIINRDLAVLGQTSSSRLNPLSHTFVATTNSDGSVNHTYSWGNDANLRGWNLDQALDHSTAQQALSNGQAQHVGESSLDPFAAAAFAQLDKPENEHVNLFFTRNCKTEAHNLVGVAKQKQFTAAMQNFLRNLLNLNFDGTPKPPAYGLPFGSGGDQ